MLGKEFENALFTAEQLYGENIEECEFTDCIFDGCVFEECGIYRTRFENCQFRSCRIVNPRTEHSQLIDAEFTDCALIGVHWGTMNPPGRFAEPLRTLEDCRLKYCTFEQMNLRKFRFSGCELLQTTFAECQLNESSFSGCNLDSTAFYRCDLRKSDFRHASGYQIDTESNQLKGARFSFPEVVNLLSGLGIRIEY